MQKSNEEAKLGDKRVCQSLHLPQFFSSLPSAQSSSPSHFHSRVMQRPLVHWNWELSHLPFFPLAVASLSRGAQHRASSSHSAQRADVPMLPARMVPPPPPSLSPFAPHNKLPALRRGGRRWGRGGRRRGGGGRSKEPGARRARKEQAPLPCNLHALLPTSHPATHPLGHLPCRGRGVRADPAGGK